MERSDFAERRGHANLRYNILSHFDKENRTDYSCKYNTGCVGGVSYSSMKDQRKIHTVAFPIYFVRYDEIIPLSKAHRRYQRKGT